MDTENGVPLPFPDSQLDFNTIPFGFDHDGFGHDAFSFSANSYYSSFLRETISWAVPTIPFGKK
jgi:hypothetical protein